MSVTAVPLRPLDKGTVAKLWIGMLLVVLIGAGIAWAGTRSLQFTTTESGLRYRVMEEGEGNTVTPEDLVELEFEILRADGTVLDSTARAGRSVPATVNAPFPGLRDLILVMRRGGMYQAFVTAEKAIGQPIPQGARITGDEVLEFRIRAGGVLEGMAAMQQMMGPGGPQGEMGPPPAAPAPGGPGGR